jgi:hypothetical protein
VFAVGGDDNTVVSLAKMQVAHEAQTDELLARTSLRVAMIQIPTGGFERWWRIIGLFAVLDITEGWSLAWVRAWAMFIATEVVFLVADHIP